MQKRSLILVVNAGSSSLKWALFTIQQLDLFSSGIAERIGLNGGLLSLNFNKETTREEVDLPDHNKAVQMIIKSWTKRGIIEDISEIKAVGFRVVHGGPWFSRSVLIDEQVIAGIERAAAFAPLHNPPAIKAIKAIQNSLFDVKLVACFDTAFHLSIPQVNHTYALPHTLSKKHQIRRYGFHGLSHQYITERVAKELAKQSVNFINLHLGNGASLCAIKDSKSFDTSMGLTPLQGLVMGTRSGDIDPAIFSFLNKAEGLSLKQIEDILNKESGLLGASGISSDLRDIETALKNGDSQAKLAFEIFAQRTANYLADYHNKLGGELDCIVFTAGIGENSSLMREEIVKRINFKRIIIDRDLNNRPFDKNNDLALISTPDSELKVFVIRTNEEIVIARETLKLA